MVSISRSRVFEAFPAEGKLILACCCSDHDEARRETLRDIIQGGLDWDTVNLLGQRHWMRPLMYHHLKQLERELVPDSVMEVLTARYARNGRRNLAFTAELIKLVSLFEDHGIEVLPYKGPIVAQQAYGSLTFREFGDLDLLVRQKDLQKARQVLLEDGFETENSPPPEYQKRHFDYTCQELFIRDLRSMMVELQWAIAPWFYAIGISEEELWSQTTSMTFHGKRITAFSPNMSLFVLSLHGSKHLWERLEWLSGVAQILRTGTDIDWDGLLALARRSGTMRMFLLGPALARDWLGVALPEDINREIEKDRVLPELQKRIAETIWEPAPIPRPDWRYKFRLMFQMRERMRDRIRFIARRGLTPHLGDWEAFHLPPALHPVYYVTRPFRLMRRYALGKG